MVAGETAIVAVLAGSMQQAGVAFRYILATIEASPMLRPEIVSSTADSVTLRNGVQIVVRPASYRTIRGATLVAAILDEVATWRTGEDSSNPDFEVIRALKPALLTTGGPMVAISSPYAKQGSLWEAYRRDFGPDGDPLVLVAQAASRVMNPTLPQAAIDKEFVKDPESAAAEFGAQFRSDIGAFVTREAIEASVSIGVTVRPPISSVRYFAGMDPSGGSSDSMTLCVSHADGEKLVVDCIVEKRPSFSPDERLHANLPRC